jgi:hypothetical protein
MKTYESFTLTNYDQAAEYHKNYMRNVRSALNRHRKDIGHLVDIVKDNDFKTSKAMLSSKMKYNLKKGLSRPTKHHPIIPNVELSKINEYISKDNPVALRLHVWYALAIHFVSRGCEFHHQLTMRSLKNTHTDWFLFSESHSLYTCYT